MTTLKVGNLSVFSDNKLFAQSVEIVSRSSCPELVASRSGTEIPNDFLRKCEFFSNCEESPKNRNFPKRTSRWTLERVPERYNAFSSHFFRKLAVQQKIRLKWYFNLSHLFISCLYDGHWTRFWPSRFDREHQTTVNHGKIQPNRADKLISEKCKP